MKEDVASGKGESFEHRGVNINPGKFFDLTMAR
jgi:hypothetical protein